MSGIPAVNPVPPAQGTMGGLLSKSDLASGLCMAAFAYMHHQKHIAKLAGYNVLSSIAGRYVSYWLSGGAIDNATAALITPSIKNYLVVALVRFALAKAMHEGEPMLKSFDTMITDVLGAELLVALGMSDSDLVSNFGSFFASTANTGR